MRVIFLILVVLLTIQKARSQENVFYDEILGFEHCSYCYFVTLDVESKEFTGKVVIENDSLYGFISKYKGLSRADYNIYVKDLLLNKKKLSVENAVVDRKAQGLIAGEVRFGIVETTDEVEAMASRGCIPFVKYYFLNEPIETLEESNSGDCREFISKQEGKVLLSRNLRFGASEQYSIINKLFEWKTPVRLDDLSGTFILEKQKSVKTRGRSKN